jgi:hypothetical protein
MEQRYFAMNFDETFATILRPPIDMKQIIPSIPAFGRKNSLKLEPQRASSTPD